MSNLLYNKILNQISNWYPNTTFSVTDLMKVFGYLPNDPLNYSLFESVFSTLQQNKLIEYVNTNYGMPGSVEKFYKFKDPFERNLTSSQVKQAPAPVPTVVTKQDTQLAEIKTMLNTAANLIGEAYARIDSISNNSKITNYTQEELVQQLVTLLETQK